MPYWDLPTDLTAKFASAQLVIVKGDANYRRLCGDLHWPFDTDFQVAMSYFPSNLLALRTLKSGVCLGVPASKQLEAQAIHPGEGWLTKGAFGLIQLMQRQQ